MRYGQVVKLINDKGIKASKGALAIVCKRSDFPDKHKTLYEMVGDAVEEFVWVRWLKTDWRYSGHEDGAFMKYRFCPLEVNVIN